MTPEEIQTALENIRAKQKRGEELTEREWRILVYSQQRCSSCYVVRG